MHNWRRKILNTSRRSVFTGLMLLSAGLLLLPTDLLRPARSVTQLIAIPQWAARRTTAEIARGAQSIGSEPVNPDEYRRALQEKAAIENEAVSLRQQLGEAQQTIEDLTRLRSKEGLKAQGTLIPARVIGLDAAAGRDTLLVAAPSKLKAKQGDWVASRMFIDAGSDQGVRGRLAVLARECLIGWIEESSTFASRVVLLTDPQVNRAMQVQIDASHRNQPRLIMHGRSLTFPLSGEGRGKMRIPDIDAKLVDSLRYIRVGDLVTSDPGNPRLPVAMVIGKISDLRHNRSKPLFYDAVVTPLCEPANLNEVYVVDMSQ